MKYEYSQTMIFNKETFEIVADIKTQHNINTDICFVDNSKNREFYEIYKSLGLEGSLILSKYDLRYLGAQRSNKAYEYAQFMDKVIDYLEGKFKTKEGKK